MQRGAINNALQGFLGTYTSRYTEWRGYWLFGFIVADLDERGVCFELLTGRGAFNSPPMRMASNLASKKFKEQMEKTGVPPERVISAQLELNRLSGTHRRVFDEWLVRDCYEVLFTASATSVSGKLYSRTASVLVAPFGEGKAWKGPP